MTYDGLKRSKGPLKNVSLLIMCAVCLGCAPGYRSADGTRASLDSSYLYEIVDPLEELKIQIKESPQSFSVPLGDVRVAGDRTVMFFKEFIMSKDFTVGQNTVNGQKIFQGSSAHYKYAISTRLMGQSAQYNVQCIPIQGGTTDDAELNAHNLARFIRDGQLEKMLLVK